MIVKREEWVNAGLGSAPGHFMSASSYPAKPCCIFVLVHTSLKIVFDVKTIASWVSPRMFRPKQGHARLSFVHVQINRRML